MRYVDLPSGKRLSVLGFGCSALMGRAGRSESLRALAAAHVAGITFFDTARSYGYGESESLLGEFLGPRRQDAVICTKFGILPAAKGGWKQRIKPFAQQAIRIVPALRGFARRQAANQMQAGQFSLENMHRSLETSLRALRTDYVDMLLLHAAPLEVIDRDDLFEALERLVQSGKVLMAGISGEHGVIAQTISRGPRILTTAQFAVNLTNLEALQGLSPSRMLDVANHPFGGPAGVAASRARIEALRNSVALPASLREKLGPDDPMLLPEVVLNLILNGTGIAAVVPAMMQPQNLQRNVRAVEQCRFSLVELNQIRNALTVAN